MSKIIREEIGKWFKTYRESYEWPKGSGRRISEEEINSLCLGILNAVRDKDFGRLRSFLIGIHRWKTNNRQGVSNRYENGLKLKGDNYLEELIKMAPFEDIQKLKGLITHLKIPYCNLPVCSAIASFLYGRNKVPIIDKFVGRFFSKKFNFRSIDKETKQVVNFVKRIPFEMEAAPFIGIDFEYNFKLYIEEFIPECERIAKVLIQSGVTYEDLSNNPHEFTPQDVEMAIFSWATKHKSFF